MRSKDSVHPDARLIHRRDFLKLSGAGIAGATLLPGCFGAGPGGSVTSGGDQTLTVSNPEVIADLDPHGLSDASAAMHIVARHVFSSLVVRVGTEIQPSLATNWDQPEPTTWEFTLRDDAKFHDGSPVTAEDVKASLERLAASDTPLAPLWDSLEKVEARDAHTVSITTTDPLGTMLPNLTLLHVAPARHLGEKDFFQKPLGSGAFEVESFRPGESVTLVANEDYWGDPPALSELAFSNIPEVSSRLTALETGEIDMTWGIPPDQTVPLEENTDITLETAPSFQYYFNWFNSSRKPFTDVRVRRAMWHAIDTESIVNGLFSGGAKPAQAPIPSSVFGWSAQEPYDFNPQLARQLLADAGYPQGFDTSVMWTPGVGAPQIRELAETLISNWNDIGVTVQPLEKNETDWLEDLVELKWDMDLQTNAVITGDADYTLGRLYHSDAERNGYANPQLDKILVAARTTSDQPKREELYAQANQIIWDDAVGIFPAELQGVYAWRSGISGVEPDPAYMPLLHDVQVEA